MILKSLEQLGEGWEAKTTKKSNGETQYLKSSMVKDDLDTVSKKFEENRHLCYFLSDSDFSREIIWSS